MINSGFPDLLAFSRMSRNTSDLKARSEQARTELVTGRITNLPGALGADIGPVQLIRKSIDDIAGFQQTIARAQGRATASQIALENVSRGLTNLGAQLLGAIERTDNRAITLSAEEAGFALNGAFASLNQRFDGKSLFAGDGVDNVSLGDAQQMLSDIRTIFTGAATPADLQTDLDFYFDDPAGGFATSIYQGGAGNAPRAEISQGEIVAFAAKADEQAIRDVLRGLATIIVGAEQTPSADRDAALSEASGRLISASDGVTDIRARIGGAEERMRVASDRLGFEDLALTEAYNSKTARDPFEAASLLQQLESQLQATFVLTSRISQLSLVNYLR